GKDYVAVDGYGRVLARADKETILRGYPNDAHFTGSDFPSSVTKPESIEPDAPVVPNLPGVAQTSSGHPVSDARADDPTPEPGTRTHPLDDGTPYEGSQT